MASQYSLNLKCILDTTQVQQELQKLRQAQNQSIASTSNNNGLGNLTNLTSTLQRLSNSINQLNLAINKLNNQQLKQVAAPIQRQVPVPQHNVAPNTVVSSSSKLPNIPFIGGNQSKAFSVLNNYGQYERDIQLDKFIKNNKFRNKFHNEVMMASSQAFRQFEAAKIGALPLFRQFEQMNPAEYSLLKSLSEKSDFQKWYTKNSKNTGGLTSEMKRMLGGMAFGQGVNAVNMLGQSVGWWNEEQGSAKINAIGRIGQYAVMGSTAGPLGIAIGGVIGALEGFASILKTSNQQMEKILQDRTQLTEKNRSFDKSASSFFQSLDYKDAIRTNDRAYFQNRLNEARERFAISRNTAAETGIGFSENALTDYQNQFGPQAMKGGRVAIYKKAVRSMQQSSAEIDQLETILEKFDQRKNADSVKIVEENNNLENNKRLVAANNDIISAELLGYNRMQTNKLNSSLINEQSLAQLKRNATFYKGLASNNENNYLSLLNQASGLTDGNQQSELLKKANIEKLYWQFNSSQSQIFESAIKEKLLNPLQDALTKLVAPSLTNVNSLASQGYMTNRADDAVRINQQIDFERRQTELQEAIKKILETKSFVSTIG